MQLNEQEQTLLYLISRANRHGVLRTSLVTQAYDRGVSGEGRDAALEELEKKELITSRKLRHVGKSGPKPTKYEITRKGERALAAAEAADK